MAHGANQFSVEVFAAVLLVRWSAVTAQKGTG
jgi:hypothetical protein